MEVCKQLPGVGMRVFRERGGEREAETERNGGRGKEEGREGKRERGRERMLGESGQAGLGFWLLSEKGRELQG